jgi:predicted O-linked N-acetylglucosamine transferase (SPINDLY family)
VNDLIDNTTVLNDLNPESKEKVQNSAKTVIADIKKSSKNDIVALNQVIEKNLKIPDNILLLSDSMQNSSYALQNIEELEEECNRMGKIVLKVKTQN